MGFLSRVLSTFGLKASEGEYRDGPYYLPSSGGWLSADAGKYANWWQLGYNVESGSRSAMVEACVSAYAQTVAMCPGNQWRWEEGQGRSRVGNSALVRVLRQPNAYQSISDFLLNAIRSLLLDGNGYALALRNDRMEVVELHLMRSGTPQIAETGDVFYHLSGNEVIDRMIGGDLIVPARDVLHLRLHTPRHPLRGETPLEAASLQLAAGNAALMQQVQFYNNNARPSFILSTDQILSQEQVNLLREKWNDQAAGMATGGTPITTAGLKPIPISVSAVDSALADMLKLSDQAIANVYRVPLQILGIGDTPYASTEALMRSWKAGGLGFILNHIEEAMGLFFRLRGQPDEYVEFDTSALLRSAFKERVEAWAAGVKGGIFDRNTARRDFEQADAKGGDEPWVQQQDIPLSVAAELAKNPPKPPPAVAPPAPPEGEQPDAERAFHEYRSDIEARIASYATQSLH